MPCHTMQHLFYYYNAVITTKARDTCLPLGQSPYTSLELKMLRSLCSCHKHNHEYNLANPDYKYYS